MKIKIVNQRLYLEPPETAEGTREYLRAEFSFSEEWNELTKTAFFRGANGNTYSQLLENDACTVPAEALAAPGRVGVSVSGTLGETVITTDIKSFTVPATLSGGTPSDPGPTLWQEVLDKFEKVSEVEEKVTELDKKCDTIPTRVSQLENNSGFLTEHQDISGKLDTEKLPEAIDTALAQAKESGVFDGKDGANGKDGTPGEQGPKGEPGETTYVENPYDDTELKSEIATKITAPENPEVGKVFKIKSVNDDGTFIGEWTDCANLDVRINGESIVRDGVAEIPVADYTSPTQIQRTGLVHVPSGYGISFQYNTPNLIISNPPTNLIDNRNNMWQADYYALTVKRIDYAVKSAMCDGKGAAWTEEEQAAARERMGAWSGDWQIIMDETLAELTREVSFKVPDDTKEMICFFKSGATSVNTVVYLRTNNIDSSVAESYAPFGGSLINNGISIGCQKIQFLNSQYGLVEYSYLSHLTPSTEDKAQRIGKPSVLRIDNKRFYFHSTNINAGYPAETRFLVFVRR